MTRLLKAAAALLCALGLIAGAHAQTTTITASHLLMKGTAISTGTAMFVPVNAAGAAIPVVTGSGGGLNSPQAFACTITAGALSGCSIPDSCLATPPNFGYNVTLADANYQYTMQQVPAICGATWALDAYAPPANTVTVAPIIRIYGTAAPTNPCNNANFYIRDLGEGSTAIYVCGGSTWTAIANSGSETRWYPAAICNSGVAYSAALSAFDNNAPQLGCMSASTSSAAWMAFQANPAAPQYAQGTFSPPGFWTGSDMTILFESDAATSGNVSWVLESGCVNANGSATSITYGTPITITTAVSSSASGIVPTTVQGDFALPNVNGCTESTSLAVFRIHRATGDSATGDAHLLGVTVTSRRSQ